MTKFDPKILRETPDQTEIIKQKVICPNCNKEILNPQFFGDPNRSGLERLSTPLPKNCPDCGTYISDMWIGDSLKDLADCLKSYSLNSKGESSFETGSMHEAIEFYDKALYADPKNAGIWTNKGIAMNKLNHFVKAIECFEKSISLDDGDGKAWAGKATALRSLGRNREAVDCFKKAASLGDFSALEFLKQSNIEETDDVNRPSGQIEKKSRWKIWQRGA